MISSQTGCNMINPGKYPNNHQSHSKHFVFTKQTMLCSQFYYGPGLLILNFETPPKSPFTSKEALK
jgi:hypothetical protein